MKRPIMFAEVCIGLFCLGVATASSRPGHKESNYETMLVKLKDGDTSIDFSELRSAYAASSEYEEDTDSNLRKEMYSALQEKKYAKAIKIAHKALRGCYLDIDAHQVLFLAYHDTHQEQKAEFHHNIVKGLIGAILNSGDGQSKKSAYVVNSTCEEYIILQVMGVRPGSQSMVRGKQHSYDQMVGVNPTTKEKITLYFNIDRPMLTLQKELSGQ